MKLLTFVFALLECITIAVSTAVPRDLAGAVISDIDLPADCSDGESKCVYRKRAIAQCQEGSWEVVHVCNKHELCLHDPSPQCVFFPVHPLNERTAVENDVTAASEDKAPIDDTAFTGHDGPAGDFEDTIDESDINGEELPCTKCRKIKSRCMAGCWSKGGKQSKCNDSCKMHTCASHVKWGKDLGYTCNYFCPREC